MDVDSLLDRMEQEAPPRPNGVHHPAPPGGHHSRPNGYAQTNGFPQTNGYAQHRPPPQPPRRSFNQVLDELDSFSFAPPPQLSARPHARPTPLAQHAPPRHLPAPDLGRLDAALNAVLPAYDPGLIDRNFRAQRDGRPMEEPAPPSPPPPPVPAPPLPSRQQPPPPSYAAALPAQPSILAQPAIPAEAHPSPSAEQGAAEEASEGPVGRSKEEMRAEWQARMAHIGARVAQRRQPKAQPTPDQQPRTELEQQPQVEIQSGSQLPVERLEKPSALASHSKAQEDQKAIPQPMVFPSQTPRVESSQPSKAEPKSGQPPPEYSASSSSQNPASSPKDDEAFLAEGLGVAEDEEAEEAVESSESLVQDSVEEPPASRLSITPASEAVEAADTREDLVADSPEPSAQTLEAGLAQEAQEDPPTSSEDVTEAAEELSHRLAGAILSQAIDESAEQAQQVTVAEEAEETTQKPSADGQLELGSEAAVDEASEPPVLQEVEAVEVEVCREEAAEEAEVSLDAELTVGSSEWGMTASRRPVGFASFAVAPDEEEMADEDLDRYLQDEDDEGVVTEETGVSRSSSVSSGRRVRFADEVPEAEAELEEHCLAAPLPSPTLLSTHSDPSLNTLDRTKVLPFTRRRHPTNEVAPPSFRLDEDGLGHTAAEPALSPVHEDPVVEAPPEDKSEPSASQDQPASSETVEAPSHQLEEPPLPETVENQDSPQPAQPEDQVSHSEEIQNEYADAGEYVNLELPSSQEIVHSGMAGLNEDLPPIDDAAEAPGGAGDGPGTEPERQSEEPETEPADQTETSESEPSEAPEVGGSAGEQQRGSVVASTHIFGPTLESFRLTESELTLGRVKPAWIPDAEAPLCMLCEAKFSLTRRRHHCRACGRVLCGGCCGTKAHLPYLAEEAGGATVKEARVCDPCAATLHRIADFQREAAAAEDAQLAVALGFGTDQTPPAQPLAPERSAGLLRPPDVAGSGRRVVFGDGLRPGEAAPPEPAPQAAESSSAPAGQSSGEGGEGNGSSSSPGRRARRMPSRRQSRAAAASAAELETFLGGEAALGPPPPDVAVDFDWPLVVKEGMRHRASPDALLAQMEDPEAPPVEFAIKRNLTGNVKLLKLECCHGGWVWAVSSVGLRCVAQDEVLVLVEREEGERRPPFDLLRLFNALYEEALQGNRLSEMDHVVVAAISGLHFGPGGFLGSQDHAGLLFLRPSLQCMEGGLPLPDRPYLVGLLLLKSEVPWAKVLPMRLLLRLGAAAKVYPCPVVSVRGRQPLFGDIGQTIMNLLADFRNYSYALPWIQGSRVQLEDAKTTVFLPRAKQRLMLRTIEASRAAGSVVAWAADLNFTADSHLVAIQTEGQYRTQTINIQGRERQATGASFVVINGALRSTQPGVEAKSSIVEDGLMLQLRPDEMERLLNRLKDGQDYELRIANPEQRTDFAIRWVDEGAWLKNRGLRSPVDGRKLEGLPCLKVSGKIADHSSGAQLLRMTELFVVESEVPVERLEELQGELLTLGRHLTSASAKALLPFATELAQTGLRSLGIRVTLGPDVAEFTSGAGGQTLPEVLVPALDSELVPLLYAKAPAQSATITLELLLRILDL